MPYAVVRRFEEQIAEYSGARFGVSVESGTAAIFLSLMYVKSRVGNLMGVTIPSKTYPSVACSIINAGGKVHFSNDRWEGVYELKPYRIFDAALRFRRGMFYESSLRIDLMCLSFHSKKHLPIGRGGMILTDDPDAVDWLKKARFDGRDECDLNQPQTFSIGWNMYLTPEQAARGLQLFAAIKNKELPDLCVEAQGYPDLREVAAYRV